ncbi:MAG: HAMP domain-containing protein [Desulfomonilaceae bacterium]
MKKESSLERKMLSYFGLIAAASLLITVEFVWAIRAATPLVAAGKSAFSATVALQAARRSMESLQNKALLMFVVQAVVTLIVLIMFMRRITSPLQEMVEEAKNISEGDLSRTIPVHSQDEIGLIGETINSLTSNIQEIVSLGLSTEAAMRTPLSHLRQLLDGNSESAKQLDYMEAKLDSFKDIAECFKLLPPPLEARRRESQP